MIPLVDSVLAELISALFFVTLESQYTQLSATARGKGIQSLCHVDWGIMHFVRTDPGNRSMALLGAYMRTTVSGSDLSGKACCLIREAQSDLGDA